MPSKKKEAKLRKGKKPPDRTKRSAKFVHPPRQKETRPPVVGTGTRPNGSSTSEESHEPLLESEEKYRTLFNEARDGIALIELETGQIVDCNSEFENQTGRKLKRLKKMKIWEVRPPGKVEAAKKKFFEIKEKEIGGSNELEFQKPNGEILPVEFVSRVVKIQDKEYIQSIARDIAERKRTEEALEETNRRLQTLLDNTHMMVAYLDPQFNFVRVNRAYAEADGRVPSFFPGRNHFDLYPNAENEEIFRRVIETGEPYFASAKAFEYAEHPERGVSYWDWSLIPIKNSAGAATGLVLTLLNVTERHRAEEALKSASNELEIRVRERTEELTEAIRELRAQVTERKRAEEQVRVSEEKYKTLVQTSSDMIFTVDLKGNFLFTNQAFEKSLGYSAEEIQRINGFDLVHPEDLETVREQFAALVEGKGVDNMEYKYRAKDGSYISILNNASPILDSQGNVVAALGVARDITGRKRAEKALQESELWMRNMFNSLEEAVFVVTPDRTFVNINPAAEKMFGYTKSELADLSTEVLHVDHGHYVDFGRRIKEAFDREETARFEFEAKRKNGVIFPTEHTVSLLKNDKGEPLGIVSVVRDISERKRAEEELKQYREHLEELVEERTAELRRANEQLEQEITERAQAEKSLERELAVNKALAELSDALITPSSSISDIANILLDSAKSLTQSEHGYVSSIDPITRDHVAHTLTEMMGKQCLVGGEDKRITFSIGADGLYPSLWGHSLNTRKAFLTNAPNKHEASRGVPAGHIPIKNFLSVPAVMGEELVGQIALANSPRDYTDHDLEAVKRLAELYAMAIQRKRTEESLKAEKEFTETALNAQTDTFFVFEPSTGRAVRWNKAFSEISGYSDEEIRSMKAPDSYYNEEDLKKAAAAAEKVLNEGIATVELSLITKDGRSIPTEYTGSAIRDDEGNPKYIIAVGRDVTERRQAEKALRESEEKFRNLAEQSPNMIFINKRGRVVYANKACEEIIEYKREEFYSPDFDFFTLISPEHLDVVKQSFSEHVSGEEVPPYEYALIAKSGKRIEALHATKLIKYEGESAILGIVTDITKRKRGEEEIKKLNESLEYQAKELAAANKELEAFSYSVSHDLRAPLRALDGFSRALMEDCFDKLDEGGKDYLRRIRGAAQHMGQLIDDLLNLSLVMRKEMRHEKINLSELARTITAELQKTEPDRQVEFVIQEEVLAHGDPRLLREVLENLLSNAWKFTAKHAQAKIEFGATQKKEQTVYFVRDDGAGFDIAYIDKLFVPFQRLHSAAEFSGNGIGLAVVSRIINRHGGRIWAEGEVEKGATFYFTLE